MKNLLLKIIMGLFMLVVVVACKQQQIKQVEVPYYNTPAFTAIWTAPDLNEDTLHKVPDFSFTDQFGHNVSQKNTEGKIYLVNFFFTSCSGICPRMTDNLLKVHDQFKKDPSVMIISHSVDPEHDQTQQLMDFAQRYNISDSNWLFVTGNKDSIYTLARKGYFVEQMMGYDKTSDDFLHSENIILIDKHRHIRGIYNGTVLLDAGRMKDDIEKLKKEN